MRRVPEFDGLRGVAAVMILGLHLGLGRQYAFLATAVNLFFVLSGYLISLIVLEYSSRPSFLRSFCARRILRIWPIYYGLLLAFLAVNPWLPERQRTTGLPYYLTFTQFSPFYWGGEPPAFSRFFGHTWTLAAEEQFYLLWPLIASFLGRRVLLGTIPILLVSAFVARLYLWPMLLVTTWDGFGFGALLAWWLGTPDSPRSRSRPVVPLLLALGAAATAYPLARPAIVSWLTTGWPAMGARLATSLDASRTGLFYFAVIGLVIRTAGTPLLRPLRHPSLVYVGTISYGLYLFHEPLYALISPSHFTKGCTDGMALDAAKLAATFALAIVSWELFEKPILRLKARFPYPPLPAASNGSPPYRPHVRPSRVSESSSPSPSG